MFSFILRVNLITEGCVNDMEKHFCQLSSIHQRKGFPIVEIITADKQRTANPEVVDA